MTRFCDFYMLSTLERLKLSTIWRVHWLKILIYLRTNGYVSWRTFLSTRDSTPPHRWVWKFYPLRHVVEDLIHLPPPWYPMISQKGKVGSLPSHQLLWFLASITSTWDSNPDLPAPRPADHVTIPLGHRVGWYRNKPRLFKPPQLNLLLIEYSRF